MERRHNNFCRLEGSILEESGVKSTNAKAAVVGIIVDFEHPVQSNGF